MNECRAISFVVDPLQIYDKPIRIVFRVRENFGAEESENMIYNDMSRFICEVCIVDAKTGVKPIDFIGHELARHKSLVPRDNYAFRSQKKRNAHTLAATSA
jgi:hypothetical protein